VRLLFAADLHGDRRLYGELYRWLRTVGPDALILGGDLFPNSREIGPQLAFACELRAFLRAVEIPVFAIPGNVDWPAALAAVEPEATWLTLTPSDGPGGLPLVGYGCVPPKGSRRKDWERRDLVADASALAKPCVRSAADGSLAAIDAEYLNRLPSMEEDLASLPDRAATAVWVIHAPPFGCGLDRTKKGAHAGSRAVRARIEQLQPPLTLHGHIHEAPRLSGRWAERLGRTICVNPGRGQPLHAAVIDLDQSGRPARMVHTVTGPSCDGTV
jgi:uncharacterized protein